jgi:dTDP-4-dehydrorhamnose reductase
VSLAPAPRFLVTGATGQLGFDLVRELAPLGTVIATDRAALHLAEPLADGARGPAARRRA